MTDFNLVSNFDNLASGEELLITNETNPMMMLSQLSIERPNEFTVEYLTEGPKEWKVKITKNKKEGCCGCCGM